MSLNKIILLFIYTALLHSCAEYQATRKIEKTEKQYYSSSGFALIYEDKLYTEKVINKKMNNEDLRVMHSFLKTNTPIKVINPENSKFIETKIYKTANYPKIFNVVISKKIASILGLDTDNPYVEIIETKKNKTFIAKEGNIYEEEKQVVETAPIDEVKMDNLSAEQTDIKKGFDKNNNFVLVISDFYYYDSAKNLKDELIKKTQISNFSIKKINDTKYRLSVGPFKNFNALKSIYISLNNLGFEGLNIYREQE